MKTKRVSIRLPEAMVDEIEEQAGILGMNRTEFIKDCVRQILRHERVFQIPPDVLVKVISKDSE